MQTVMGIVRGEYSQLRAYDPNLDVLFKNGHFVDVELLSADMSSVQSCWPR
jgi:hypothetical protein